MSLPPDFSTLVRAYADDLYRYAKWLCRDSHRAEDLVQETFLRSWRGFAGLRNTTSAKAWLITTLRREHFRAGKAPKEVELEYIDEIETSETHDVEQLENALDAERCLERLPMRYREVLFLQLHFGYSTNEIAELLEITEPAVANRLLRARRALKAPACRKTAKVTSINRNAS